MTAGVLDSEFFEELERLRRVDSPAGMPVAGVVIGVASNSGELGAPFMRLWDVERQVVAVLRLSGARGGPDLVVPLLGDFDADIVDKVMMFNAIGVLAVGHPVALEYNGQRIYPAGPARVPHRQERRAGSAG